MRADMKQVLIERPRSGWRLKHKRTNKPRASDWNGEDDYIERQAPRLQKTKRFDDLLSPLRRYLRSQIGRPWDKIYSEICANLDQRSVTGIHVLQHLRWEVQVDCRLNADGRPDYPAHRGGGYHDFQGLYVHPRSGLLCYLAGPSRRARRRVRLGNDRNGADQYRDLGNDEFLLKRNGIWYWAKMERIDSTQPWPEQHARRTVDLYIGRYFFLIQRTLQLSHKELRQHGLSNDVDINV